MVAMGVMVAVVVMAKQVRLSHGSSGHVATVLVSI